MPINLARFRPMSSLGSLDSDAARVFVPAMQNRLSCLPFLLLAGIVFNPVSGLAQAPAAVASPPVAAVQRPAAVAPAASTLSPAQAQQTLEVLRDDKRRAELINTLDAIAKAAPAAAALQGPPVTASSTVPAAATTPAPAIKSPLVADSLGAQLITQVSSGLSNAGGQFMASLRSVNDLPLLWRWIVNLAGDTDARTRVIDALWKTLVVMGSGLAIEWGARFLLRRIRAAVARSAEAGSVRYVPLDPMHDRPPIPPGTDTADAARSARAHRLSGALNAFKRLPYLLGLFVLDLVPIGLFGVISNILVGTWLGEPASTGGTILIVAECYLTCRVVLALTRMLVSPASSHLRLLQLSDWASDFLTRWIRRIAVIGISGYAIAGVGLEFNMYRTAYDTLLKLFALVVHICLVVAVLQAREPVARRIHARHGAKGPWAILLNRVAEIWHLIAIFYIVALWLVWAVELRNGYVRLVHFFFITAVVLIASRVVAIVLLGGLDKARALPGFIVHVPGLESRANVYYPFLRVVVLAGIAVATILALLEAWGLGILGWFQGNGLGGRSISALILIGVTVLLAILVWEGVNAAIDVHLSRLSQSAQLARAGRLRTLLPMLRTVLLVTIVLVVALMALDELGVNIAPLLAGAGVIGIAVGFGSQKLVQDLITGLFLLLENAMQVGDVVTLGGLSGTVEALSIRTIRLRALDGSVHIIPFSAVTTVTNQTRDYGYAVLDVSVGLNEEPERIVEVLKNLAETMRKEPRWQSIVLEPLDVMGVEKFVDSAWVMRVRIKTQPSSRWSVARELNRRIKVGFDDLAIESPFTSYRVLSNNPAPIDPQETPA